MEDANMLKDVIAVGGTALLIPAVLFGLLHYIVRGLFGFHGRKSQRRREFLDRWDPARADDDLWLEVTIRQLFGTYLPAHVIRLALARPNVSDALIELSELWRFFRYDPTTQTIRWEHARHRSATARRLSRYWPMVRYLLFALATIVAVLVASRASGLLIQWIYSASAIVLGASGIVSVMCDQAEKLADVVGESWINAINTASVAPRDEESVLSVGTAQRCSGQPLAPP